MSATTERTQNRSKHFINIKYLLFRVLQADLIGIMVEVVANLEEYNFLLALVYFLFLFLLHFLILRWVVTDVLKHVCLKGLRLNYKKFLAAPGTPQYNEEQILSNVFMYIGLGFLFWLMFF